MLVAKTEDDSLGSNPIEILKGVNGVTQFNVLAVFIKFVALLV